MFLDVLGLDGFGKLKFIMGGGGGGEWQMQWLKLPACKVGDRGFEPHSGLQISKKQTIFSLLTREDSILLGSSVAAR